MKAVKLRLSETISLEPECDADREAIALLAKAHAINVSTAWDSMRPSRKEVIIEGVVKLDLEESPTMKLAEALYMVSRSPGMRPWNVLDSSERNRIVCGVENLVDKLKAIFQGRGNENPARGKGPASKNPGREPPF